MVSGIGTGKAWGGGPIWPLARPCAWDLGSACFMERGSFLVCGAFWLSTRRETYIWKALKEKKEWGSGELTDFFSADGGDDRIGDPLCRALGIPWGLYGHQKVPENI